MNKSMFNLNNDDINLVNRLSAISQIAQNKNELRCEITYFDLKEIIILHAIVQNNYELISTTFERRRLKQFYTHPRVLIVLNCVELNRWISEIVNGSKG